VSRLLAEIERRRRLEKIRGKVGGSSSAPARPSKPGANGGGFAKIDNTRCGPRKGSLTTLERELLPPAAFAQPGPRKYPLYVISQGTALPDREHAVNAKARAAQQYDAGRLSFAALGAIIKKADIVIDVCDRIEAKPPTAARSAELAVEVSAGDNDAVSYTVSGRVGRIELAGRGHTALLPHLFDLDAKLIQDSLVLNRAAGGGAAVPYATRRKVIDKILEAVRELRIATRQQGWT